MCMLVNTSAGNIHTSKSLIVVPNDSSGISVVPIEKMGMHASDTGIVTLDNVHVPVENLIGEEGMGFTYQMLQFQEERLACAAGALVPLETVIQQTIDYTRQRQAFGKSLLDNQVVHFRMAELQTEVELLRVLLKLSGVLERRRCTS